MATISAPWDLVTAPAPIPNVSWWALTGIPTVPQTAETVRARICPGVQTEIQYGLVQDYYGTRAAFRKMVVAVMAPDGNEDDPPIVSGFAAFRVGLVDDLLVVFQVLPEEFDEPGLVIEWDFVLNCFRL